METKHMPNGTYDYCDTKSEHTKGAIKAAEVITGGKYGNKRKYLTEYGRKTVEGIADLIDRETAAPELLEACELADPIFSALLDLLPTLDLDNSFSGWDAEIKQAQAKVRNAISKAKGQK